MVFRMRLLRLRAALLIAVLVAVIASNRPVSAKFGDSAGYSPAILNSRAPVIRITYLTGDAGKIYQKVNYQRALRKLKPLLWDEELAELADAYSEQMSDEDFFSHFDLDGRSVVDRAAVFEIENWAKIGENLFQGKGFVDMPSVAVKGWMASKTHRINILDREWTHTGVGVFVNDEGRSYITQVFLAK